MERNFATLAGPMEHYRKASAFGRVVAHSSNVLEEVFEGENASGARGAPVAGQVEGPNRRRIVSPELLGEIVVGRAVARGAVHQDQRVLGVRMLVTFQEEGLAFTAGNAPVDWGLKRAFRLECGHGAEGSVPWAMR